MAATSQPWAGLVAPGVPSGIEIPEIKVDLQHADARHAVRSQIASRKLPYAIVTPEAPCGAWCIISLSGHGLCVLQPPPPGGNRAELWKS